MPSRLAITNPLILRVFEIRAEIRAGKSYLITAKILVCSKIKSTTSNLSEISHGQFLPDRLANPFKPILENELLGLTSEVKTCETKPRSRFQVAAMGT
jgi:hypothetical protein